MVSSLLEAKIDSLPGSMSLSLVWVESATIVFTTSGFHLERNERAMEPRTKHSQKTADSFCPQQQRSTLMRASTARVVLP